MSLSINFCSQLTTDRQKARAREFVNRSDREVTSMAVRKNYISHNSENKRISKAAHAVAWSLPVVAAASSLALKQGIKPSLKRGAGWGLAVAVPAMISGIDKAMSKPDENGRKTSMPTGLLIGTSLVGYLAASAGLEKLSRNAKVNKIADTLIDGAKETFNKIKPEIKVPERISEAIQSVKSKIKMPETLATRFEAIKNKNFYKQAAEKAKEFGKSAKGVGKTLVAHAPSILAIGTFAVILGSAVKQGLEISATKSRIKNAQLNTAKDLINTYAEENEALKEQA